MRWTLIALLSGQPVPTGVFFGKHYECLVAAGALAHEFKVILSEANEGNPIKTVVAPTYACIPSGK